MSLVRAWFALVSLSIRRQARMRQMVWIALALLALTMVVVGVITFDNGWGMQRWRYPRRVTPPQERQSYQAISVALSMQSLMTPPLDPRTAAIHELSSGTFAALLQRSPFLLFARWCMFSLFVSFLMPIWSLSFATEALAGEREARTLVWLLTRPLPRSAIYLAKFVALLPWCLIINVGGFLLICLAAGEAGRQTFRLFWPAVAAGTLAFVALFQFFSAWTRWPIVIGLVYAFFLEVLLGDMPGLMKRISISFYVRCLMFDAAEQSGLTPDKPQVYMPVDGHTAWIVILSATAVLLLAGMYVFALREYGDDV
jgi:ABC-type transport system involved in multi-copper enzyme maturation permease subunit